MLKRKMEQKLIDWKNTENHKPLIIKGADNAERHFLSLILQRKTINTLYI